MPFLPRKTLTQLRLRLDAFLHEMHLPAAPHARAVEAVALEQRVLYSASPIDGPVEIEQPIETIYFIDKRVDDLETLVSSLSEHSSGHSSVVVLDETRDGIEQISETLRDKSNVRSVHLLSHGNADQLNLGRTTLTSHNLAGYAGNISAWKNALSEDADLYLYGCDLASSESGRDIIHGLGALCGCDVAASIDATGAATLGGDWDLEYHIGEVNLDRAIGIAAADAWSHSLSTYTVTSTLDDGSVGTLRWAIQQANANAGADRIEFNIPDSDSGHVYYRDDGVTGSLTDVAPTMLADGSIVDFDPDYPFAQHSWFRIDVDAALPRLAITDTVVMDGLSQPGASENTLGIGHNANLRVELTQSGTGSGTSGLHIESGASGSTVRGLVINDFESMGILVHTGANGVTIQSNYLGTDITGTVDVGNLDAGIQVRSNDNLIGGALVRDRNVISGNEARGVAFFSFGTIDNNVVQNNYIGVDATGLAGLGNDDHGLQLWDTDNTRILTNVISGNETDGILARAGSVVRGSLIQGNFLGVGADGTTVIANGQSGIRLNSNITSNTTIGGTVSGAGNIISGNRRHGVLMDGASVTGTSIWGNFIGTDRTGTVNLGNGGSGVFTFLSAEDNWIGGVNPGEGNLIGHNSADGVTLSGMGTGQGYANRVRGNQIFSNGQMGIDLLGDGQSPNDDNFGGGIADSDDGPNRLQNHPNLLSARLLNGDLILQLEATSDSIQSLDIDFYASSIADPSGYGQGERYLGSAQVFTNAQGKEGFLSHVIPAAAVGIGDYVTATTSHADGSTSEFSLALPIIESSQTLLLAMEGNENNSGTPGIDAWQRDQVLEFGGPNSANNSVTFGENTTDGTFSTFLDLERFTTGGQIHLNALHYVESDLTIGTGGSTFDLIAGDVLFAFENGNRTFTGASTVVTSDRNDVTVFRPSQTLGYSTGDFYHLLDDPTGNRINALALVEAPGGVTFADGSHLAQGTFLVADQGGGAGRNIEQFTVTSVGAGNTSVVGARLVDGQRAGVDFDSEIEGLALVGGNLTLGGVPLSGGDLLVTLKNDDSDVGTNDLSIEEHDIFIFRLTNTELTPGNSTGTAISFFDGDDVMLDGSSEAVTAISLQFLNSPPTDISISNDLVFENTDTSGGFPVGELSAVDLDVPETFTYSIVPGDDAALFTIGGSNNDELTLDDGVLDHEIQASYFVTVRVVDSAGNSHEKGFTINVTNVNEPPTLMNSIGAVTAVEDQVSATFDLNSVFEDPDSQLVFNVSNSNTGLASASISGGILTLDYLPDQNGSATLVIEATDGEFLVQETVMVTVAAVNDAPLLSGTANLTAVRQDSFDSTGEAVSTLLIGLTSDIDLGSSLAGVTVIGNAADASNEGAWEYSTDLGVSWHAIGNVDDGSSALAINASALLRFVPVAGYSGSPGSITLRALDNSYAGPFTSGAIRVVLDTTQTGGIEPISIGIADVRANVVPHGILVAPTAGLVTTEAGGQATFEVVLLSIPSDSVNIPVSSSDAIEGGVSTNLLTFDPTNWNVPQTVLVTGADDWIDDGDRNYTILLHPAVSTDASFHSIDPNDVVISNLDDDDADVAVSQTIIHSIGNSEPISFSVLLTSQPTAAVVINVTSGSPSLATVPASLTFLPTNWNVPQTVTVDGLPSESGTNTFQIVLAPAISADPNYQGIDPPNVNATITRLVPQLDLPNTELPPAAEEEREDEVVVPPTITPTSPRAPERAPTPTGRITEPQMVAMVAESITTFTLPRDVERPLLFEFSTAQENKVDNASVQEHSTLEDSHTAYMGRALDGVKTEIEADSRSSAMAFGSVTFVASAFSVGYITWLIRGGQLLMSVLAQLPAWQLLDPLPILAQLEQNDESSDEDDSLASMVSDKDSNKDKTQVRKHFSAAQS